MTIASLTLLAVGFALLSSAAGMKLVAGSHAPPAVAAPAVESEYSERPVSDLAEAECLLDWLEAEGFTDRQFTATDDGRFVVRWRA
jgi:hypothetical protein